MNDCATCEFRDLSLMKFPCNECNEDYQLFKPRTTKKKKLKKKIKNLEICLENKRQEQIECLNLLKRFYQSGNVRNEVRIYLEQQGIKV